MSNFSAEQEEEEEMAFVINLADGTGREFYISVEGQTIPMDTPSDIEPLLHKTLPQADRHREKLLKLFPASCRLYGLDRKEFEFRRQQLQGRT